MSNGERDVEKFALQAGQWWDPDGPLKTLHQINPLRFEWIQKHRPVKNQCVLDVGCGGGILAESMAVQGASVTGIDLAAPLIEVAKHHASAENLTIAYHCLPVESLVQQLPGQFDIVTCMELIEHVESPEALLSACATLLKPGGTLFLSTLNRNIKSWWFAIVMAEYLLSMLPKGTHEYHRFIRPSELESWAIPSQLVLQRLQGISYSPMRQRFYLGKDLSVNYMAMFESVRP